MELASKILSNITIYMKYAKYIPSLERRESWTELVDRNKAMHIKTYPNLTDQIEKVYKLVYDKKVLPSMRSLQFSGKPIETINNGIAIRSGFHKRLRMESNKSAMFTLYHSGIKRSDCRKVDLCPYRD